MKYHRKIAALLVAALLVGALAGCTSTPAPQSETPTPAKTTTKVSEAPTGARADLLVTVDQLKAEQDSVIIWDCRSADDYKKGHIKGAVNAPWQMFAAVTAGKPGDKGWGTLLPAADIAKKLGELGIDTSKQLVLYSDPSGWGEDGRNLWMLRMAGVTGAKMLDGGFPAWKAAGNEVSTDEVKLPAATVSIASLDESWNVTTDYIKANQSSIKIIDARSEKEFGGATDFGEKRGGHLPGALNIPFPQLFNDDGTVKSDADLKAVFDKAGVTPADTVVVYCTKGIRSGYMTDVLRMLGYENAKNWDASYYEWAGDASLAVEK